MLLADTQAMGRMAITRSAGSGKSAGDGRPRRLSQPLPTVCTRTSSAPSARPANHCAEGKKITAMQFPLLDNPAASLLCIFGYVHRRTIPLAIGSSGRPSRTANFDDAVYRAYTAGKVKRFSLSVNGAHRAGFPTKDRIAQHEATTTTIWFFNFFYFDAGRARAFFRRARLAL